MRCLTPEISWHNRDPVLSIDIQSGVHKDNNGTKFWRVASGGADSHVLIWHLMLNDGSAVTLECVEDLERHQKAVNVVRFAPSKQILASGDDESAIILWRQKEDCDFFIPPNGEQNKEQWTQWKILRGHVEDVYDISWSPDANFMISGSVDNTAILWDVHKGRSNGILSDHKGFVQGVSWDPCNRYVCTIGTDRQCRLIDITTKKTVQRVHKSKIPTLNDHPLSGKEVRLFYDDTFKSYFRRLTFTPDGELIIVPSGIIEPHEATGRTSNATIIFSRYNIREPLVVLPSMEENTIAVRCCPVYFKLRDSGPTAVIPLPYRIVFAVATQRSVLIYDTQQSTPIVAVSNIHYTRLTDLTWSSDGQFLIVSSTDGYCSVISFQEGELGELYELINDNKSNNQINRHEQSIEITLTNNATKELKTPLFNTDSNAMDVDITNSNGCTKNKKMLDEEKNLIKDNVEEEEEEDCDDDSSEDENGLIEKQNENECEETEDIRLIYNEESETEKEKRTPQKGDIPVLSNKTPRRVKLITLSSPKETKKS